MLPILIVMAIATVLAIVAYQLIIQKHYLGPKGPPENEKKDTDQK